MYEMTEFDQIFFFMPINFAKNSAVAHTQITYEAFIPFPIVCFTCTSRNISAHGVA